MKSRSKEPSLALEPNAVPKGNLVKALGPGLLAGSPIEHYDAEADVWASVAEAYRVISERMAAGGQGWKPRDSG